MGLMIWMSPCLRMCFLLEGKTLFYTRKGLLNSLHQSRANIPMYDAKGRALLPTAQNHIPIPIPHPPSPFQNQIRFTSHKETMPPSRCSKR